MKVWCICEYDVVSHRDLPGSRIYYSAQKALEDLRECQANPQCEITMYIKEGELTLSKEEYHPQ